MKLNIHDIKFCDIDFVVNVNEVNECLQKSSESIQKQISEVKSDLSSIRTSDSGCRDQINQTHENIRNLIGLAEDVANSAKEVSQMYYDLVAEIFLNIEDPQYPIDQNGLHKVPADCAIWSHPTDHYRYLDPYLFIENATAAFHDAASMGKIDLSSFTRCNPEDMYVVSILTRTVLYAKTAAADDQISRFYTMLCCIGELGEILSSTIANLWAADELITSDAFRDAKVRSLNESDIQDALDNAIHRCIECINDTENAANCIYNVSKFYDELNKLMGETSRAIKVAYKKYIECNHITF